MNEQSRGTLDLSVTLSTLADPAPPAVSEWEFETVKHWAKNWLSKSHPNLGRTGAVCPFTGTSIKKNLFRVAFVRGNNLDHDKMVGLLEEIAAAFPVLPPEDGPGSIYKAVVVVFPEVTEFGQIDAVQGECKNAFVQRGLMVGQFYPGHQQGGLRNPDFRPLDAPFAMLAVRHMVVTDYPFLCGSEDWMVAYVARFAPAISVTCPLGDPQEVRRPGRATTPFDNSTPAGSTERRLDTTIQCRRE
jgi:hypothetical protein